MADLHVSEITLRVGLDDNRVPERLSWSAQDGGIDNEEAKAMLLSVWDSKNQESLKIDLWTKDMPEIRIEGVVFPSHRPDSW